MHNEMNGLHPIIKKNILKSNKDGGIWLKDVAIGDKVEVKTNNSTYILEKTDEKDYLIMGNDTYCPTPTPGWISGSTWGGSMIKAGFVGVGMHLEFGVGDGCLISSEIKSCKVIGA